MAAAIPLRWEGANFRDEARQSMIYTDLELEFDYTTVPVLTASFKSIDRFLQDTSSFFCLCFDPIGARHPVQGGTVDPPGSQVVAHRHPYSQSTDHSGCGSRVLTVPLSVAAFCMGDTNRR